MAGISTEDRKVAVKALERAKETGGPAAALELEDGRIITGKTTNLLGASAALLLNVLKELAGLDHSLHIISPESIEPIQKLKVDYLKSRNPRLHTDEVLIALSASAANNPQGTPRSLPAPQTGRMPGAYVGHALGRGYQDLQKTWRTAHL